VLDLLGGSVFRVVLPAIEDSVEDVREGAFHQRHELAAGVVVGRIETGRARPSRELILHLAERLDVPMREHNPLLLAAGFAPIYTERPLDAPEMSAIRAAVDVVLKGHQPYPALAVDFCGNVVAANPAAAVLSEGMYADAAQYLRDPPVNVYRISLHPQGMAPRVANFDEYAPHLVGQLRHDVARMGDPRLAALLDEIESYSTVRGLKRPAPSKRSVVVPLRLQHPAGELTLFTSIATFGTPSDITVSELAIESFFPAGEDTATLLSRLGA
jgi:hypothetical protein